MPILAAIAASLLGMAGAPCCPVNRAALRRAGSRGGRADRGSLHRQRYRSKRLAKAGFTLMLARLACSNSRVEEGGVRSMTDIIRTLGSTLSRNTR